MPKDYAVCEESGDKKHSPDPHSVKASYDGGAVYVDVNCKHCGQSGCIGMKEFTEDDIVWD